MKLNTEHLSKTSDTLAAALQFLQNTPKEQETLYDLYRNAVIKSFELSLETSGKLLRRLLKQFVANPTEIDQLFFNDVFRHCAKYGILDEEAVSRWLKYRKSRNQTAHDYGEQLAEETLQLLPDFINDIRALIEKVKKYE